MSRRQILLLTGCAWASCRARLRGLSSTFTVPELQQKSFLVPKVDASGNVVSREPGSASYYLEDMGEGVKLEMVAIPGGTFQMGSNQEPEEQPVHTVTVPSFFLGGFEVTRGQWRRALTLPRIREDLGYLVRLDWMPEEVENAWPVDEVVFFFRAEEFCARLARSTGRPYRLPSEAEWEYACRAGTTTPYHFGDAISLDVVNYNALQRPLGLIPVGSKNAPNAFGLHDMHGNVAEWCLDWEHSDYVGAPTDGSAWVGSGRSTGRVIRGGMYDWNPHVARSAARSFWLWDWATSGLGFRVALGPYPDLPYPRPRRRP